VARLGLLVAGATLVVLVWSVLGAWRATCFVNDTGPLTFESPSNPVLIGRDARPGDSVLLYGRVVNRSARWATLTGFETSQWWGPEASWLVVKEICAVSPGGRLESMSPNKPRVPPGGSLLFVVKAELLDVPRELLDTVVLGATCHYRWMGMRLSALSQVPWIVQPGSP